jgi:glucoamylase
METIQIPSSGLVVNSTASSAHPIMHAFSSLLLLGSYAVQHVLGRPESDAARSLRQADMLRRDVDDFVSTEEPIAYEQIVCNIGSTGCNAGGVGSGLVLASPSTSNPDCKSTPKTTKSKY